MKNLTLALLSLLGCGLAQANEPAKVVTTGFDGCYQLYMPNTMYPAFCLQGTLEEGINGSGVRLAIFHTNTSQISQCYRSSSSAMTHSSYDYYIRGSLEMSLVVDSLDNGRKLGSATIGESQLKFIEMRGSDTSRLMNIANTAENCF